MSGAALAAIAVAAVSALWAIRSVLAARRLRRLVESVNEMVHRRGQAGGDVREPLAGDRDGLEATIAALRAFDVAGQQRQRADEQLRRLFVGAMERIRPYVFLADASGAELFRNAPGASTGSHDGDALLEGAVRELLREAVAGMTVGQELRVTGPPRRDLVLRAFPVEHGGERFGAVAIADDITELRRIERVRRDFVANISHELRTPLGALAVLAETASTEPDPAILRRLSGRMEHEAHRLTAMVDDLLALSRVEGESEQGPMLVDVARVLDDAVARARPSAAQNGIAIELAEVDPSLRVIGYRPQLVSAVHNLLENALKYSDKGEPVTVRAAMVDDPDHARELVEIRVVDHGIGIPPRDRERIFERFYRVDRARARDTGGTGLGLAIVRHVAVNHNGDVLVQSIEGEGSTFVLRLPLARLGEARS